MDSQPAWQQESRHQRHRRHAGDGAHQGRYSAQLLRREQPAVRPGNKQAEKSSQLVIHFHGYLDDSGIANRYR